MINWARVADLKQDLGEENIGEIFDLFLTEVETIIDALRGQDFVQSLQTDMHFLKGSALNLGFDVFGHLCSDAEKAASEGATEKIDISGIVATYDASKEVFKEGLTI